MSDWPSFQWPVNCIVKLCLAHNIWLIEPPFYICTSVRHYQVLNRVNLDHVTLLILELKYCWPLPNGPNSFQGTFNSHLKKICHFWDTRAIKGWRPCICNKNVKWISISQDFCYNKSNMNHKLGHSRLGAWHKPDVLNRKSMLRWLPDWAKKHLKQLT